VVPQLAESLIPNVAVRVYAPKLSPEIVTEEPPEAALLKELKIETVGESKLRAFILVPTAAETVSVSDLV